MAGAETFATAGRLAFAALELAEELGSLGLGGSSIGTAGGGILSLEGAEVLLEVKLAATLAATLRHFLAALWLRVKRMDRFEEMEVG